MIGKMLGSNRWRPVRTDDGLSVLIATDKLSSVQKHLLARLRRVHIDTEGRIFDLQILDPWVEELRSLVITDHGVRDVSAVTRMLELKNLVVYGDKRLTGPPSLSGHLKLTTFAGTWDLAWKSLWTAPRLRSIDLERPSAALAHEFAQVDSLRSITLRAPKGPLDLSSRPMPSVSHLRLGNAQLKKAAALGEWIGLQDLTLQNVHLDSWDFLGKLPKLNRLILEDCGDIPSLAPLSPSPLQELRLIGGTNVVDGDLLPLRGLSKASFPYRSHYNARPDDLTNH